LTSRSPRVLWFYLVCGLLTALLIVYARTKAFAWDEGFHLVTAQLIKAGKRPYIDWVFSQPPLNAYWNALWMRIFGESWRVVHTVAALSTAAAVFLIARLTLARFPVPLWRLPLSILTAILVGTNVVVVQFGTVGQAYGLALLAITAAFAVNILSPERKQWMIPFAAGVLAGVGACSTLLTAPVGPVLLIWMLLYDRTGSRWSKLVAFVAGEAIPFLPVAWLFALGPRQTFFGIIQYNLLYRQVQWPGAIRHDLEIMAGLIDFPQGIVLCLLALAGLLFVHFRSGWDRQSRGEFYLCAGLAIALTINISSAHPTFARYYLFTAPFLSYLAAAGLYWVGTQLRGQSEEIPRPWLPVILVSLLVSLSLAKALYDSRDDYDWTDLEALAAQVEKVTPPGKTLYANEQIYFLLHRTPPSGHELHDSHKLEFPPERAALLHVIPQSVIDKQIQAGQFDTIASCQDEDWNDARHLGDLYAMEADAGECAVYWGWKGRSALLR
jgi:hypothetical protein